MSDPLLTRSGLLRCVRDPRDNDAWTEFVELYSPLIFGLACRRGLRGQDAQEGTQEVFLRLVEVLPRFEYDRAAGKFRNWLFTVAHNTLASFAVRNARFPRGAGGPDLLPVLEQAPDSSWWDENYVDRVWRWAAERAREFFEPNTLEAFRQVYFEGRSVRETALRLGMSEGAVSTACSKVKEAVKRIIRREGV